MNKINRIFTSKERKELIKHIAEIKPASTKLYLEELSTIGRLYGTRKIIDINMEDKVLENLAKSDDSIIFVMNHGNQKEDPKMLAILNTLLCDAYLAAEKEQFPIPKIILNEDILKTMDATSRKAFENLGAIGIDANIAKHDASVNARAFFPILRDFANNKCNIFIFPEGRLASRKKLTLFNRFQKGVPIIINKMLSFKPSVTVVPVGFAYGKGKNKNFTSMQIGTPVVLKRTNNGITTITQGDILKDNFSIMYDFFNKNKSKIDIPITQNSIPVSSKEVTDYIHSIICENLEINLKLAEKKLETAPDKKVFKY